MVKGIVLVIVLLSTVVKSRRARAVRGPPPCGERSVMSLDARGKGNIYGQGCYSAIQQQYPPLTRHFLHLTKFLFDCKSPLHPLTLHSVVVHYRQTQSVSFPLNLMSVYCQNGEGGCEGKMIKERLKSNPFRIGHGKLDSGNETRGRGRGKF